MTQPITPTADLAAAAQLLRRTRTPLAGAAADLLEAVTAKAAPAGAAAGPAGECGQQPGDATLRADWAAALHLARTVLDLAADAGTPGTGAGGHCGTCRCPAAARPGARTSTPPRGRAPSC